MAIALGTGARMGCVKSSRALTQGDRFRILRAMRRAELIVGLERLLEESSAVRLQLAEILDTIRGVRRRLEAPPAVATEPDLRGDVTMKVDPAERLLAEEERTA